MFLFMATIFFVRNDISVDDIRTKQSYAGIHVITRISLVFIDNPIKVIALCGRRIINLVTRANLTCLK